MITKSQEDYLKVIYSENLKQNKINNKFIADKLKISAPSVSAMLKKLHDDSFIDYSNEFGIFLTKKGINVIKTLLSKHRLWEVFLIKHLKYTWDEVHNDADKLEHVTSCLLMNKLNEYLNYPKTCPHGKTIYINDETEVYENTHKLSDVDKGFKGVIKIIDDNPELLVYLSNKEILINLEFKVVDIEPFDQSIIIKHNNKTSSLSNKAAKRIYVQKIK